MNEIHSYADALRFLYSFADYERHTPRQRDFQHLDNVRALLGALGDPHLRLRTIHVAGTKGKGSTVAMLTSVLVAAGNKVGTYTSPHLNTHRERYQLDGAPVSEHLLTSTLREIQPLIERVRADRRLTTFEVATAFAFELFVRQGVDWAVIEVGLGGRLDTTNVLTPVLSVITSVSIDHAEVLGDTVEAIAGEKAGIIKPGIPVVVSAQVPEAMRVIRDHAADKGSRLLSVGRLVRARHRKIVGPQRQGFTLDTQLRLNDQPLHGRVIGLNLIGTHQVDNALTAITALCHLDRRQSRVDPAALLGGLETVRWPGRFEVVSGEIPIVLDGAHNPDSMRKLRRTVEEVFPGQRAVYVFGSGGSHDAAGMMQELEGNPFVLCRSTHPRSKPVAELAELASARGVEFQEATSVEAALETARGLPGAEVIVVCGTLFVVAEAREALGLAEATDPVRS
jgi:dihydrofolate synthase/folylpolyglutamate synthase